VAEKFAEIHRWMFNKIKYLDQWAMYLYNYLDESGADAKGLQEHVEQLFSSLPAGDIEEIIDHENIHNWLSNQLNNADLRLAAALKESFENDYLTLDQAKRLYYMAGERLNQAWEPQWVKPSYLYRNLTDALVEGMPCDKAMTVTSHDENHIEWTVEPCTHRDNWDSVGLDISIYYQLRDSWIKGFIEASEYEYISDHPTYRFERIQ